MDIPSLRFSNISHLLQFYSVIPSISQGEESVSLTLSVNLLQSNKNPPLSAFSKRRSVLLERTSSMKEYDVVIIGSGAGANLIEDALQHNKTVAVVDKGPLGGTCLNTG